jgi:Protein of unknown function (DUF2865)
MPEKLTVTHSRSAVTCAALLVAVLFGANAHAQTSPPPPGGAAANPMCPRLETQLASIDRGGADPAKDEQIRRYQDSAARQQAELDRVTSQARRMGCESSGFFSLFNGQNAQCGPVNNQIQQMRANLDQITTNLERLRSGGLGGSERESQRRSVLLALAQNNCGPQYAAAVQQQQQSGPGNFLNSLFGGNNNYSPVPPDAGAPSGTYRTVCVRSCDGGYFPISFATVPGRFADDEKACKALCPATEASLYTYRNPGEDMNQAVSIGGQTYTSSPNAFKFRSEFNPSCACKAAGQTWSDALKSIDDKAAAEQQGDIIVTEEGSKKMARPQAKSAPAPAKKGSVATTAPDSTPPSTSAPSNAPPATSDAPSDNKQIRTVGPTFIPPR